MTIKEKIMQTVKPIWLQVAGLILIVAAYILFGLRHPYIGWLGTLLPVGILELTLKWVWNTTITSFARRLLPKTFDIVVILGLIPLTWWWFGPNAAGLLFIGVLLDHLGEVQPKNL